MSTHINNDNLRTLLVGIAQNLRSKIDSISLNDTQKSQLALIDKILKTGDGTKYLSDNGTYKNIPLDKVASMTDSLGVIYDLLKIQYNKGDIWSTNYTSMPTSRYGFGCIQYNGKIYCIGGYNGTYLNKVEVYDIFSNTWSTNYTSMPTSRYGFGCVQYNGKIYCIGGSNSNGSINKVDVYDISSNTWSTNYANMPTVRYEFGCIQYNGKIYCIAGINTSYLYKVEVYDINSNVWSTYKTIPTGRYGCGVIEYNSKIYCIGGYSSSYINKIEVYDINSNTWDTNYKTMPTPRCNIAIIKYNSKIYCIGGEKSGGYNNIVEVYDITTDIWTTNYTSMPTIRSQFGFIEYNDKIYCIGGYTPYLNKVEAYQLPYVSYNITLPSDISNKLSLLVTNGTGTKLLTDNGTYQEYIPTGYREMNSDEISLLASDVYAELQPKN